MGTFIARRLLYSIPVLLAATMLVFFGMTAVTDPVSQIRLQPNVSQQTIQNIIDRKHLDDPLIVQYGFWLKDAFFDQFGNTALGDQPIWPELSRAIGNTLQLVFISQLIAVVLAVVLGVFSAKRQYSFFDYATTTISFFGFSVPIFWFALILQALATAFFLSTGIRLVYTFGISSLDAANPFLDRIQHMALPIVTLSYVSIATFSRFQRASMLEVLHSDYIRTARAKGVKEFTVTMKHGLRNALIPVVTVAALNFGAVLGGAVITETIFAWPGMGKLFIDALNRGEVYTLMAWMMVTAVAIIFFNMLADIVYGWLDPRIRFS
ncbi:MAG: ABC transporter permease [Actinobacteria bacterium]|nr:MAG: ABC transporter permease [Actinomycetota bacterium]REK42145.1 MAG: ABC transporter permease [Actinomycetota bacterium]